MSIIRFNWLNSILTRFYVFRIYVKWAIHWNESNCVVMKRVSLQDSRKIILKLLNRKEVIVLCNDNVIFGHEFINRNRPCVEISSDIKKTLLKFDKLFIYQSIYVNVWKITVNSTATEFFDLMLLIWKYWAKIEKQKKPSVNLEVEYKFQSICNTFWKKRMKKRGVCRMIFS